MPSWCWPFPVAVWDLWAVAWWHVPAPLVSAACPSFVTFERGRARALIITWLDTPLAVQELHLAACWDQRNRQAKTKGQVSGQAGKRHYDKAEFQLQAITGTKSATLHSCLLHGGWCGWQGVRLGLLSSKKLWCGLSMTWRQAKWLDRCVAYLLP